MVTLQRELDRAMREHTNLLNAIKQGIVTPSTKAALQCVEQEIEDMTQQMKHIQTRPVSAILPRALQRYQEAVHNLEMTLGEHVESAREILRSLLGSRITLRPKGDHYEAEVPDHAAAMLMALGAADMSDLSGAGCPDRCESYRVCLAPTPRDSTPLRYRKGRRIAA